MNAVKTMEPWQLKKIFAIARTLGIDKDDLHAMAEVDSLKELDSKGANEVLSRLEKMQGGYVPPKASANKTKRTEVAGMATNAQCDKIWALMYSLKSLDNTPVSASLGERVSGIMAKELHLTATEKDPFKWLSFEDAGKIIEIIKQYVRNAKKKGGGSG